MDRIPKLLSTLYGRQAGTEIYPRILKIISDSRERIRTLSAGGFSERDSLLITYPDMVRKSGEAPLRTLHGFCREYLGQAVTCIHLLPFYPSSSDDGFSVIDYRRVDPGLGEWSDVEEFGREYRLMFDAVFNHVSAQSAWFRGFLDDEEEFRRFFIDVPEGTDLSLVARPRALPLLTEFQAASGRKLVWTTFSADQADLNFAEPAVLLEILETLLFYAERGAALIRLDAIGYIWKKIGTRCIHLTQAHGIVRMFRAVLDRAAPHVVLVTETNVPHRQNVSYFGDGAGEAQAVYNFALPPLVLHSFYTGDARVLSKWAAGLSTPSREAVFLNFLASHDGIGLTPASGILSKKDIEALVERAVARGAMVSFRSDSSGAQRPYELNISYWDALGAPGEEESLETRVDRFIAAHALMFALPGVPAVYFHSLFGSTGWREGALLSGNNRSVNRQKLDRAALVEELRDADGRRARVFTRMKKLLLARAASPCFHPQGRHRIVFLDRALFAILRDAPGRGNRVLCLHNVANAPVAVTLDPRRVLGFRPKILRDIMTGLVFPVHGGRELRLGPYQGAWLAGEG